MAAMDSTMNTNGVSRRTPITADLDRQQRYSELLEKRIAQLEAIVDAGSKALPNIDINKSNSTESNDVAKVGVEASKTSESAAPEDQEKVTEEKKPEDKKEKLRYRNIVRQWDKKTGAQEDVDLGEIKKIDNGGDIAFTFRRVTDPDTGMKDADSEIDIEADGLRELLKEQIGNDYPGQNFDGDTVEMSAPFAALVHNWEKLQNAAVPNSNDPARKQAREDLTRLLETVEGAPELEKYFKTRESNLNASITTYETMWTLFPPKTKIVAKPFLNTLQVFVVEGGSIPYTTPAPKRLSVLAWCWDWNGKEMTKVYYYLPIEKFRGTKDINQLPCYPIKYHKGGADEDEEELCKALRTRGAKYNKIVRSKPGATQMYSYNGEAVSDKRSVIRSIETDADNDSQSNIDDERNSSGIREKQHRKTTSIQGEFIVDTEAFLQYGAGIHILGDKEPCWVGELNEQPNGVRPPADEVEKDPNSEDFLLFPPRLLGYSTKEKMWGQFGVDQTSPAPGKQPAMFQKQLQLEDRYKAMIQALVDEHEGRGEVRPGDRTQVKDIVKDKGKGLVLLLHGPPGVGKTLTAETIAEATGKPLFIVSVAEIGLNASKAEKNLEQMFYLAGKWEAVLLVDEADVFLESRSIHAEPNRNALVSVLLRVLEYYHGIMILTTNRINSIDVAVQSRIHLAIRYDDLTKEQKQSIFKIFLDQLHPDNIRDTASIYEFIDEYGSEYKLNGRQIRNVVSSALSLARSKAKETDGDGRLDIKHLKTVLGITKDFQEQLEAITNDARAQNEASKSRR